MCAELVAAMWACWQALPCEDVAVVVSLGWCFLFVNGRGWHNHLPCWFMPCSLSPLMSLWVLGEREVGWGDVPQGPQCITSLAKCLERCVLGYQLMGSILIKGYSVLIFM